MNLFLKLALFKKIKNNLVYFAKVSLGQYSIKNKIKKRLLSHILSLDFHSKELILKLRWLTND